MHAQDSTNRVPTAVASMCICTGHVQIQSQMLLMRLTVPLQLELICEVDAGMLHW